MCCVCLVACSWLTWIWLWQSVWQAIVHDLILRPDQSALQCRGKLEPNAIPSNTNLTQDCSQFLSITKRASKGNQMPSCISHQKSQQKCSRSEELSQSRSDKCVPIVYCLARPRRVHFAYKRMIHKNEFKSFVHSWLWRCNLLQVCATSSIVEICQLVPNTVFSIGWW